MRKPHKIAVARGVLALSAFAAVSCLNPGGSSGNGTATGGENLYGRFKVDLIEANATSDAYATILGRVSNGPTPSTLAWTDADSSGVCHLRIPHAPFCDPGCGSAAACVADGVCQAYPTGLDVGTVTVNGMKVSGGGTSFSMTPLFYNYQVPTGTTLGFPPFTEGEEMSISAAGKDTVGAFSLSTTAIKPLTVLYDTVTFADGQPATLQWEPKGGSGNSSVSVEVDISHHGGLKGVIDCDGPDNGQLVIPAALITRLKALGMSGFPSVELTRYVSQTNSSGTLELRIESRVSRPVSIPGVVSCSSDDQCPSGQTCQQDFKCQ